MAKNPHWAHSRTVITCCWKVKQICKQKVKHRYRKASRFLGNHEGMQQCTHYQSTFCWMVVSILLLQITVWTKHLFMRTKHDRVSTHTWMSIVATNTIRTLMTASASRISTRLSFKSHVMLARTKVSRSVTFSGQTTKLGIQTVRQIIVNAYWYLKLHWKCTWKN